MSIATFEPNESNIIHNTKVDLYNRLVIPPMINIVQYDSDIPIIAVSLYLNGKPYIIPQNNNLQIKLRWGRRFNEWTVNKDILGCNENRNVVYFSIDSKMSKEPGIFKPILELVENEQTIPDISRLGSSAMLFQIDKNPIETEE